MQDHKTGVNFSNILNYFPCECVRAIIAAPNSFNSGYKSFSIVCSPGLFCHHNLKFYVLKAT